MYHMDRLAHNFDAAFEGAAAPPPQADHHLDGNDSEAAHHYSEAVSSGGSDATCCSAESFVNNEAFRDDATSAAALPLPNVVTNGVRPVTLPSLRMTTESGGPVQCNFNVDAKFATHPKTTPMACAAVPSNNAAISGQTPLPPLDMATVKMIHMDVEACLRQGMTKEDTCRTLTQCRGYHILAVWLVWAGLEKQNPDFFQWYKLPKLHSSTNFDSESLTLTHQRSPAGRL